jgi:hypothetical protein
MKCPGPNGGIMEIRGDQLEASKGAYVNAITTVSPHTHNSGKTRASQVEEVREVGRGSKGESKQIAHQHQNITRHSDG